MNVAKGLLGLVGGQKALDDVQVMPQVVAENGGLGLGLPQSFHFPLGLVQKGRVGRQLQLRLGKLLGLLVVGREKQHIEEDDHRGGQLVEGRDAGIEETRINGGGVVKKIVPRGQPPEEQQRLPGPGHGLVGRP